MTYYSINKDQLWSERSYLPNDQEMGDVDLEKWCFYFCYENLWIRKENQTMPFHKIIYTYKLQISHDL